MKPGTKVRLSERLKRELRGRCGEAERHLGPFDPGGGTPEDPGGDCWGCSSQHVDEFNSAVGVVVGPRRSFSGSPEVMVRFPGNLHYGYRIDRLDVVR